MKIIATADLHGRLPQIDECDLFLIAGDVCPTHDHNPDFQQFWLDATFREWLDRTPARNILGIAGNHDFVFQYGEPPDLPWRYLQDELVTIDGFRIYGTPWWRQYNNWAFMLPENEWAEKFRAIPECDIIVSHGPPYGYGDYVKWDGERVGSKAFLERIQQIEPRLVVFGHLHDEHGRWHMGRTTLANLALVNGPYVPVQEPQVFIYDRRAQQVA